MAALAGCAAPPADRSASAPNPEAASGRTAKPGWTAKRFMVAAANPLAAEAGARMLRAGGSAVDAAVAVQMVLTLVEPQSSGIGGGLFLVHHDGRRVQAFDGRETAPAAATVNHLRWIDDATDQTTPQPSARASGRSIGTPGTVRMLGMAHAAHGTLPWKDLFLPAVALATDGFKISGRMADAIESSRTRLLNDAEAAAYFLNPDQTSKTLGTVIQNPAYAATLTTIADNGPDAFYGGAIAQGIVDKINVTSAPDGSPITPGKTTLADLANYEAKVREPVCTTYRETWWVCGMPPPSSGGITVASALGVLEHFDLAPHKPTALDLEGGTPTVMGVHLVSEAERLAYSDRNKYIADTDFVPLPGGSWDAMLDKTYLTGRAGLVSLTASMGTAQPGDLGPVPPMGLDHTPEAGTSHVTIVDKNGNVVVMTTTVESTLGSYHMTQGFVLNNELTDFSAQPTDDNGDPIANRVGPNKRPRSSMAPTLVFKVADDGGRGDFVMGTGSPGGSTIIQYVVKTVVAALDWGLDAQQATSLANFGSSNGPTTVVGGEHPNIAAANDGDSDPLVTGLRALGHTVSVNAQSSGIGTIMRAELDGTPVWAGGADPRREGVVLGDTVVLD